MRGSFTSANKGAAINSRVTNDRTIVGKFALFCEDILRFLSKMFGFVIKVSLYVFLIIWIFTAAKPFNILRNKFSNEPVFL